MRLTLGGRVVNDADKLLGEYRNDPGYKYLCYEPTTPLNQLLIEDIGVTLLVNSQARLGTAKSMLLPVDIACLPNTPLEQSTDDERELVAQVIAATCRKNIGVSTATKMLHKKRPGLIPILDNRAIFGAYLNPRWGPNQHSGGATVWGKDPRVKMALESIRRDLLLTDNQQAWAELRKQEPSRTMIELFDSIWWMEFRRIEPR